MTYETAIPPGSELIFKADTIRHAAETDAVNANFVTGSVAVAADSSGEVI